MPHAILTLYFGLVPSVGGGEGRFGKGGWDPDSDNQRVKDFFFVCMNHAKEYIEPGLHKYGFSVGYDPLTQTREEAESLVGYSQKNIDSAEAIIELVDQMHGTLRLFRRIRFNGWLQERESELIEKLKSSGHDVSHRIPIWERDKSNYNLDKIWKEDLKFYF